MVINNLLIKLAIGLLFIFIFGISIKNIKKFVLIYIASRSILAIFYNVNIVGGLNILEFSGFFFPILLLFYWGRIEKFKIFLPKYATLLSFLLWWVLFSYLVSIINYGFHGLQSLSPLFRFLNGYSVFMVFPLIFKDLKDVNNLINSFFLSTAFPLLQGFAQAFIGTDIFGMTTSLGRGHHTELAMYYGLYYKYDGYAMAALWGSLVILYKINSLKHLSIISKNAIYFILFVFYIFLATLTLSRVLFLSLFIIFVFILLNLKKTKKICFISILLIFIIGSFFQTRYIQFLERSELEIKVIKGEADSNYALHGRVFIWKTALAEFNRNSFIRRMIGSQIIIGPHGDYFQWLFSFGYVGLILYINLFINLFKNCLNKIMKIRKEVEEINLAAYGQMAFAGIIIWLVEACIHNPSFYPDYWYMIIGNAAIFLSYQRSYTIKNKSNFIKVLARPSINKNED